MKNSDVEMYRLHAKLPIYKKRISHAKEIIKKTIETAKNPYVAFSCGKDSSVLAHLVLQFYPGIPLRFLSSGETRLIHNVDDILNYFQRMGAEIQEINIDRVFSEEWKNATWTEQRKAGNKDLEVLNQGSFDVLFMGLRIEESRQRSISLKTHQSEGIPQFCYRYSTGKRQNMIRCCPLASWTTRDIGAYIIENEIPYLNWYDYRGFEGRTTARLTGDAVRQNTLVWLKNNNPENFEVLAERFPEFRMFI